MAASRQRADLGRGEFMPLDDAAAKPSPDVHRAALLDGVAMVMEGKATASNEEQLVSAVVETRVLASQFRRIGSRIRQDIAWRALGMAEDIDTALGRWWKGME